MGWQGKRVAVFCKHGNSRSVGAAYVLKKRGADALSAGVFSASPETKQMLVDWAELVIVMEHKLLPHVPATTKPVLLWDVGRDRFLSLHRELLEMVTQFADTYEREG